MATAQPNATSNAAPSHSAHSTAVGPSGLGPSLQRPPAPSQSGVGATSTSITTQPGQRPNTRFWLQKDQDEHANLTSLVTILGFIGALVFGIGAWVGMNNANKYAEKSYLVTLWTTCNDHPSIHDTALCRDLLAVGLDGSTRQKRDIDVSSPVLLGLRNGIAVDQSNDRYSFEQQQLIAAHAQFPYIGTERRDAVNDAIDAEIFRLETEAKEAELVFQKAERTLQQFSKDIRGTTPQVASQQVDTPALELLNPQVALCGFVDGTLLNMSRFLLGCYLAFLRIMDPHPQLVLRYLRDSICAVFFLDFFFTTLANGFGLRILAIIGLIVQQSFSVPIPHLQTRGVALYVGTILVWVFWSPYFLP